MEVLRRLLLASLLCAMAGSGAAAETTTSLDGTWQMQRSAAPELARLAGKWQDVTVPSHLPLSAEPFAWYRRTFTLPESPAAQHVFLSFGGVKFACEVYLNGQRVGGHYGGWEPFEVEITGACHAGRPNELIVRVEDVRAVIDGDVAYKQGLNLVESVKGRVTAPVGSQPHLFGIWQDVGVVSRQDVYIEDVTVLTSVRQKRIEVKYVLRNLSDKPRAATISAAVRDGAQTALQMGSADATLPAGGVAEVTLAKPWADAKLWSPDSPHLYTLESTLASPEQQKPFDVATTRFGFREFWTDGIHLILNGARIEFLASAGHPPWNGELLTDEQIRAKYAGIRGANCVAMRLHANIWPENWYKVADEVGLPVIQEGAIWCYAENYALDKKAFWDNARTHWQSVIRRDKNHPSIVMYSIENEMLHVGGSRVAETPKNLGALGRFVKSLDPTRPIMYDGDEDPDGAADVINLHYPHEFPENTLYPDTCYWLDAKTKIEGWPFKEWEWSRRKPFYIGEFLWVPPTDPRSTTLFLGDDAYRDADDGLFKSKAAAWEMQIQAYRAADVAGMCPWTIWESGEFPNAEYDAVKRAYEPNAAYVREYDRRFYAGESVQRTVSLYNDTMKPADLTLKWTLGGQPQGEKAFSMQPGDHVQTTIALAMPGTDKVAPADFELVVTNGGQAVYRSVHNYVIYPRTETRFSVAAATRAAVFGGDAQFLDLLRHGGVEPIPLDDLGKVGASGARLLLIAPHALDALAGKDQMPVVGGSAHEELARFADAGGTVLVLEQDSYPPDMLPAALSERAATIAFKRSDARGVLGGLDDDAFKFWRGDDLVARRLISRPREGGFRVFVDTGGANGLDGVLLVEVLRGKGRYILSQLLIAQKLSQEPLAQAMLERLVSYAAAPPEARRPVGLVRGAAKLDEDLKAVGAEFEDLTGRLPSADLSKYSVLVLDGSSEEALAARQALKTFATSGGKVLFHNLTEQTVARLAGDLPDGLTVQPKFELPVLISRTDDAVTAGLTNEDLYWIEKPGDWQTRSTLATDVLHGELTRRPPPLDRCTVVEAQAMRLPPGQNLVALESGEVTMWSNASAEVQVTLPRKGEYFFGVVGHGTPVADAFPDVALYLDGRPVGHVQVAGRAAASYAVLAEADAGPHVIRLSFDNDATDPLKGEDRNLWLDKFFFAESPPGPEKVLLRPAGLVKLDEGKGFWLLDQVAWDGKVSASDQAARYLCGLLTNLGVAFSGGSGGVVISADRMAPDQMENFHREGGIAYMGSHGAISIDARFARGGRCNFIVNARGTPAAGQYPAIRLLLDGKPVGDGQLQQAGWQNVAFAADVTPGVHKLAVQFTNDLYVPEKNEDRNLWVREVSISSAPALQR